MGCGALHLRGGRRELVEGKRVIPHDLAMLVGKQRRQESLRVGPMFVRMVGGVEEHLVGVVVVAP